MIREVGESIGRAVLEGIGRAASRVQEQKSLPADVLESDDAFLAVFDAPAAAAEDVEVRFEEGTLSVHVDRFREYHEGYEMRFPGRGLTLEGSVTLPAAAEVDPDRADATITDSGTLEVRIPRVEGGTADDGDVEANPEPEADSPTDEPEDATDGTAAET